MVVQELPKARGARTGVVDRGAKVGAVDRGAGIGAEGPPTCLGSQQGGGEYL